MESLHFLNITFAYLPSGKSTQLFISPLKSLNLVLMPGAKLDGHRDTWTGCIGPKDMFLSKKGLALIRIQN